MGYITIIRPLNCFLTLISVLIGAWIGKNLLLPPRLILAGMIGFIVCAFGNVVNDLYDIDIDKLNNPERPLVKGTVKKNVVVMMAVFFLLLAGVFAFTLGTAPFILVLATLILLFLYALHFKKTIAANFFVSMMTGFSFLLGGLIVKNSVSVFPFIFSFFIHMPREIVKDIMDMKGDTEYGVISLPIRFGYERALVISALFLAVLCIILPVPYLMGILSIRYLLVILFGAYPIIFYSIFRFLKTPEQKELPKFSTLLKISMGVGVIAMII
ncbi:MAG TPA: hypothetical protein ENI34_05250 [candidate division WOR-3 bacterium]|uniref:Geranylgeranylglycerol-phosphate geranylgeranyltransferase n=1 Tax=candidate division WOR-3 bacterium TaxID=2052148 RepID=A0A9C9K035_UNCW3|nr:hypothetical protein [candidate division WOR-3 bacterium]